MSTGSPAALADGDAAVVDGQIVDEPDEVLGTIVSDDGSPTFEEIRFRLTATNAVSPGEFVAAEGRDRDGTLVSWVLCRVLDVHEVNPHEDPQSATVRDVLPFDGVYAPEGESTIIYRLVRCEPIEELPAANGGIGDPAEIRTLPRAGDLGAPAAPGHDHRRDGLPARSGPGPAHGSPAQRRHDPGHRRQRRGAAARADRRRHRQREELHPRGAGRGTPPLGGAAGQHRRQRRDDRGRRGSWAG